MLSSFAFKFNLRRYIEVNDKLLIFYTKFYVGKCVVPPGRENATVVGPA
jgi:hypothetical protein